jgi:cell division initiation protein
MRITPLDIRKQEFRKAMRGLDAEEVYAFLSTVGDEYEAVLNDNKALRDRVLELDDKVQEYRSMEKTLRDTLLTAERVTVEAKDNARREANLIIKEAQIEVEKSLRNIKSEAMKLRQEVSQLRSQRESYFGRMKVIAESLLKFIQSVETDFEQEDKAFAEQLPDTSESSAPRSRAHRAETGSLFEDRSGGGEKPLEIESQPIEPPARDRVGTGVPEVFTNDPRKKEEDRGEKGIRHRPGLHEPGTTDSHGSVAPANRAGGDPAPEADRWGDENETSAPIADINSIIERMAAGQKEILEQSAWEPEEPGRGVGRKPEQFDPMAASPGRPITTRDASEDPPQTLEATTDDPTPARGLGGGRPESKWTISVDKAWEKPREAASAVKTVDEEDESAPQAPTVPPAGNDVTGEISMDQIRRDLERRMSREKGNR